MIDEFLKAEMYVFKEKKKVKKKKEKKKLK